MPRGDVPPATPQTLILQSRLLRPCSPGLVLLGVSVCLTGLKTEDPVPRGLPSPGYSFLPVWSQNPFIPHRPPVFSSGISVTPVVLRRAGRLVGSLPSLSLSATPPPPLLSRSSTRSPGESSPGRSSRTGGDWTDLNNGGNHGRDWSVRGPEPHDTPPRTRELSRSDRV